MYIAVHAVTVGLDEEEATEAHDDIPSSFMHLVVTEEDRTPVSIYVLIPYKEQTTKCERTNITY